MPYILLRLHNKYSMRERGESDGVT